MVANHIGIFGDSWAVGSFKKLPDMTEIPDDVTFQTLFAEIGIECTNYAKGGNSNLQTLDALRQHGHKHDYVIIVQTDPIRQCLASNELAVKSDISLPMADSFQDLCENLLANFYEQLDAINIPMLLIGGCTKLFHERIPSGINRLFDSWSEILSPGFKDNYYYWAAETAVLYDHAIKQNGWSAQEFFEIEKSILAKNHLWQTSDMFSWCHASKQGYEKIFREIRSVIHATS